MDRGDATRTGTPLLGPAGLLLLCLVPAAVLALLFSQDRIAGRAPEPGAAADAVAFAFRTLAARRPAAPASELLELARDLLRAGRLDAAGELLARARARADAPEEDLAQLEIELRVGQWRALRPGSPLRREGGGAVGELLARGLADPALDAAALAQRAQVALEIERPDLAARCYREAAAREPGRARYWMARAGDAQLAGGDLLPAARSLELASEAAEG